MAELGWRKPENKVCQGDSIGPEICVIGANATAAKCLPGIVMSIDTDTFSVKPYSGTGGDIGLLGYEDSPDKPDTRDTAYKVGDFVAIHKGAGKRFRARLANGQNVTKGQPLKVTTDGYLALATINGVVNVDETGTDETVSTGNDEIFADAAESVDASTGAAPIWVYTRK